MKYSIWKWIRRILKIILFFLGLSIFFTTLFLLGLIDYQTLLNSSSSIGYLFGQLSIIWVIFKLLSKPFRTPKQPRCQTCKRQLSEIGVQHTIKKSKNPINRIIKSYWYDLYAIKEFRCYSELCYPKNERFEGKERIDYVFMTRRNIITRMENSKFKIKNLDFLDIK
jgi:hypothetical protein